MSVVENFNYKYPTLNRKDLMSLSTINIRDEITHKFKQVDTRRDWSLNLYNLDIERSSPKKISIYNNKIDFTNKNDDIEKSNSKFLHFKLNKPEYNLSNADIEKSSSNMGHLNTARCINPLEPKYTLPQVEEIPLDKPKFIRDNLDIKDIDGAIPKKKYPWKTRDTFPINNHDIKGSKPKTPYMRKTKYHNIDYSDLTTDIFKTKRQTNPLDPSYEIKYKNGEHYYHGMIEKSKPQTYYPYHHPDPYGLKVDDIHGSRPGSLNKMTKFSGNNFNLTTRDIAGGFSGTLKRGIVTQRQTNPVDPVYHYIGDYELIGNNNNAYGKTENQLSVKNEDPYENYKKLTPDLNKNGEMRRRLTGTLKTPRDGISIMIDEKKGPNSNQQCMDIVDKVQFDPEKYKKPSPNYALVHDQYINPIENIEKIKEIAKAKMQNQINKTKPKMENSKDSTYPDIKNMSKSQFYNMKADNKRQFQRTSSCGNFRRINKASNEQKLDQFIEEHKMLV